MTNHVDNYELNNLSARKTDKTLLLADPDNSEGTNDGKITNRECIIILLRANIATGILATPLTIKYAGLWTGFVGILVLMWFSVYCMHLLVNTSNSLCQCHKVDRLDYGETMELAVIGASECKQIARMSKFVVNLCLCLVHLSLCVIYILFISVNIKQFLEYFTHWDVPVIAYKSIVLLCLIPYCCLQSIRKLSVFCMIGNLFMFTTLIIVVQYCIRGLPPVSEFPAFTNIESLLPFFGTAAFTITGIGLILPLKNNLKQETEMTRFTGVLNTSMGLVTVAYLTIGFYAYLRFGLDTDPPLQGSLALSMPTDYWLYICIKLTLSTAVFMSYGIHLYAPISVIIPQIEGSIQHRHSCYLQCALRITLVIATYVCIVAIPNMELVLSVITTVSCGLLTFIFPPLMDTMDNWAQHNTCWWKLLRNCVIVIYGLFSVIAGVYTAVTGLRQTYKVVT